MQLKFFILSLLLFNRPLDLEPAEILKNFPDPPTIAVLQQPRINVKGEAAKAAYDPARDVIEIVPRDQFASDSEYYLVLFHELNHAARRRLKSGPETSSLENEIAAEIGALILAYHCGILDQVDGFSITYIESWPGWSDALATAARLGKESGDWILGETAPGAAQRLAAR